MAIRSLSAAGAYNPAEFMPFTALSRIVDFGVANTKAGDECDILPVPSAFVLFGVYVKELEKCTAGDVGIKCGTFTGEELTLGGDSPVSDYQSGGGFIGAGAMVKINTSTAMTAGKIKVTLIGFLPDGDSVMNVEHDPWREPNNKTKSDVVTDLAIGNTSKGDAK